MAREGRTGKEGNARSVQQVAENSRGAGGQGRSLAWGYSHGWAMTAPDFAIVVVNYGSHKLVAQNLSAQAVADSGALVVIVDNFHSAPERAAISDLCRDRGWALVALDTNSGFGAGVNRGVEEAIRRGVHVFVALNPDATADPEALRSLAEHVRSRPQSLVAPLIVDSAGRPFFRGATVSLRTGEIRSGWQVGDSDPEWKNWLTGACLAFDKTAFEATGGMDEDYFLYWEDVDFCRRGVAAGRALDLRLDITVVHDEGGTHTAAGSRAKSPLYYYYNCRNRLLFGRRHAANYWRHWVLATPRQSTRIWLRGGKRQLFTEPAGALAAVRGSLVGLFAA